MRIDLLLLSEKMRSLIFLSKLNRTNWTFLFVGLSLLASCSGFESGENAAERLNGSDFEAGSVEQRLSSVIRVHLPSDPVTLEPWLAEDGISLKVLGNVMLGLVEYDLEGEIAPALAASWKTSKDGLKWEFTLRPDARWSDGRPVRPAEFVAGFRHAIAPQTPSKLAPLLLNIKNARAIRSRSKSITELGVKESATESRKLIIELERPQPSFIHVLTLPVAFPLRSEVLRGNSGKWPDTAPVTGRYRVVERRLDRSIRLEPNLNHWTLSSQAAARVELRPIVLQIIQDDSTALNLFERGDLDVLSRIPHLELERIKRRFRVVTDPFLATYFLGFNLKKPPFDQVKVRQAFSAAIDRRGIVKLLSGQELPSFSWIPGGLEGGPSSSEVDQVRENSEIPLELPSLLRQALRSTSALKASFGSSTELAYDISSRNQLIAEKIQQDIQTQLSLPVVLKPSDWKTHVKQLTTDAAPVWRFGWMAPFRDPLSHLQAFTTSDPNNHAQYSNEVYDGLVNEIASMEAGRAREALIRKAQGLLVEKDAVIAPLFHAVQVHALSSRLEGFHANEFGIVRFDRLRVMVDQKN
jgi:oligopeptide transport system substrate-binding protein